MDNQASQRKGRILVIQPNESIAATIRDCLSTNGFAVDVAGGIDRALQLATWRIYDAAVIDMEVSGHSGVVVLRQLQKSLPSLAALFLCPMGNLGKLARDFQIPAGQLVSKPFREDAIISGVDNLILLSRLDQDVKAELSQAEPFLQIVGASDSLLRAFEQCSRFATRTNGPILILGERGTGKELFAKAIHAASIRRKRRLVAALVSGIPETTIEGELFGHVKGAFTDAKEAKLGWFKEADGGSLFLDELCNISLAVQAKLLRAIEYGQFRPIGASADVTIDTLIIAATNKKLAEEIAAGRFLPDLADRFALKVELPALRERREDIETLARHFLDVHAVKSGLFDKAPQITESAMHRLRGYDWPGNVRELRNVLQRAIALCGTEIIESDIHFDAYGHRHSGFDNVFDLPWEEAKERFDREYFARLWRLHPNDTAAMRQAANVDLTVVNGRIRKYKFRE